LLKTTEGSASLSSLVDTVHQTRVVELLTRHSTAVFGPPPLPGEERGGGRRPARPSDRHSESERVLPAYLRIGIRPVSIDTCSCTAPSSGSVSDDDVDGENEPLPDFLRPEYSQKVKQSPNLTRGVSPPPKIFTVSLKNMSGLEGVKPNHLTTQHSVDAASSKRSLGSAAGKEEAESPDVVDRGDRDRTSVSSSIVSINEENKVKIQVPGLPTAKEK
jgi:hypothetical protein